jgi:hypothetical protein
MGAGADRVLMHRTGPMLSPLGAKVADLLDAVWAGLYHLPPSLIDRVEWDDPYVITAVVPDHALATYDFDLLTRLVVLCHDAALRLEIGSANPRSVRLTFHQRKRTGRISERHPTMEEAVCGIRGDYSALRLFGCEHTVPPPTSQEEGSGFAR